MRLVYVLNVNGSPLMPTHRFGKVRHLLKDGKAKIVGRDPFTIQLIYECDDYTQDITLGVDAGSKHIGLSATTEKEELYSSEVELRDDIVRLLATRREARRTRRNRLRYRPVRFHNRISTKKEGWITPSVRQKIESHLTVIEKVHKILPISKIIVEVAAFDTQLLKAEAEGKTISGEEYQNGEMTGWNTREYVLFRDHHTCQHCKGKSKDDVLEVHHLESRKTGGNAPNNLLTLCRTCHEKYHKGEIELKQKRETKYNDAAFMGIMRWKLYDELKSLYPNVHLTYGYITKYNRIERELPKAHYIDAYCIAQNFKAKRLSEYLYQKKVRCHNRQIHKSNLLKGGIKKRNQADYKVFGYRLFDKVKLNDMIGFIFGRRTSGSFDIRTLDSTKLSAGISYKKLQFVEERRPYLTEWRCVANSSH